MNDRRIKDFQRPHSAFDTVQRLLSYMNGFSLLWFFVFVLGILNSAAGVLGIYMLKPAINDYILPYIGSRNPPLSGFALLILKLAVIYLCGVISTYLNQRIILHISTQTLSNIRKDLFHHMENLPVSYFDESSYGGLMSLYTNDTDTLKDMFSQSLPNLMTGCFQVTGVLVMMLILNIPLTCVILISVAFMMIISARLGKKSALAFRSQQANISAVNGYIEELVQGQKIVKIFSREKESYDRFCFLNDKLCKAGTRANSYASILGPVMNNLSHLQYAVVAMTGAVFVIYEMMDVGTIASFLQSTRSFSRPVSMISQQFNSILNALAGAERIFQAIDEAEEADDGTVSLVNVCDNSSESVKDSRSCFVQCDYYTGKWAWKVPGTGQFKQLLGEIEFTDVDFCYKKGIKVLSGINFKVMSGQKIALVGSTGSGKTTITNLLTRFYDLEGEECIITYDGIPVKDIKKSSLRKSIGMVLQDTHLFTGSIRDNIRYGNPEATDEEIEAAAKLANADYFICHLPDGYDTVITNDGDSLSAGQRQLLSIARTAVANPPVLILDEATSLIDSRTEYLIEQGMDKLMKGKTTFVIAHRLSTVKNADLILVLENGRIIEQGNHEQLFSLRGRYYQLYTGKALLS